MAKKSKMLRVEHHDEDKIVAAKYIRVSTDQQAEEGYSIDIQKEKLDLYTKALFSEKGKEAAYLEYVDDGYSGGSIDRPAMQKLISDILSGDPSNKPTHVFVMKLDRLSRSQKDTLYLIEDIFIPNNVAFVSMNESFDTSTPFGRAVVGILSVFAQLERENIYERCRSGLERRAQLGYITGGRAPLGYTYCKEDDMIYPNEQADTVRSLFKRYIDGESATKLTIEFGFSRTTETVRILSSRVYIGEIKFSGEWFQGVHQPIIDKETFNTAQALLEQRKGTCGSNKASDLLVGLLRCGECGSKLFISRRTNKSNGQTYKVLVCQAHRGAHKKIMERMGETVPECHASFKGMSYQKVEEAVLSLVFERAKNVTADETVEREDPDKILNALKTRREGLAKKLGRLYNLYAEADDDVLLNTINGVKEEITLVDKRIALEEKSRAVSVTISNMRERLVTLENCWPSMSFEDRRSVLLDLIDYVSVTKDNVHVAFKK